MTTGIERVRLGIVLLGERLAAAVVHRHRGETFFVEASESAATALRAELDARSGAPRRVALALGRAAVTVKPIDLPDVGGETREMVRFELDRHLPFPAEDAPFDVLPLPAQGRAPESPGARRVLVAAADRRVVDAALRLAAEAHLRPVSLTVASHELPALVEPPRGKRVAWVHRAGDGADLVFLSGRALVQSRHVTADDEARVAAEIRASLALLRWPEVDAVWLSGDEPGTTRPLAALGVPVEEPPWTARARRLLEDLPPDDRGARMLAVAVGTATGIRPLDLIPPHLRPRRLTRPQAATLGTLAATAALLVAAILAPGWRDARHLAAIDAELRRLEPEVRAVERVVQDLEARRRLLAAVAALEDTTIRPLPALRELTEILPNDAWLTTLTLDPKGIELTGQAAAASALIPLLENSPRFEQVEFASPVTRGRDREQFRIRAAWESGGRAAPPSVAAPGAEETAGDDHTEPLRARAPARPPTRPAR